MAFNYKNFFLIIKFFFLEICRHSLSHIKRSFQVVFSFVMVRIVGRDCTGSCRLGHVFLSLPLAPSFSSSSTLSSLLTSSFCCPFPFSVSLFISSQSATRTKGQEGAAEQTCIRERERDGRKRFERVSGQYILRFSCSISIYLALFLTSSGQWTSGAL